MKDPIEKFITKEPTEQQKAYAKLMSVCDRELAEKLTFTQESVQRFHNIIGGNEQSVFLDNKAIAVEDEDDTMPLFSVGHPGKKLSWWGLLRSKILVFFTQLKLSESALEQVKK